LVKHAQRRLSIREHFCDMERIGRIKKLFIESLESRVMIKLLADPFLLFPLKIRHLVPVVELSKKVYHCRIKGIESVSAGSPSNWIGPGF
jgi:hypothetical protein